MARLQHAPRNRLLRDLPDKDKIKLALDWLRERPDESPTAAARCFHIKQEKTVQRAWARLRRKEKEGKPQHGGQNKILRSDQEKTLIRYAAEQCLGGGKGATKQMMYNCAMYFRVTEGKEAPSWKWFQLWLKRTPELHTIKTKPITSH
jgi:hypothetical protein